MRQLVLFLSILIPSLVHSQVFEYFDVGSPRAIDTYRTAADMWHIQSLDEGVNVSIEKGGLVLSFNQRDGNMWINAACGYNAQTETADERTLLFVVANPPVMIPKGSVVRFECPPNGYAHMNLVHP